MSVSLCCNCSNKSESACKGCHSAKYCSKECQAADWPTHKLLCKAFSEFTQRRPSLDSKKCIILHVAKSKPEVVWLQFESRAGIEAPANAECYAILGKDLYPAHIEIDENAKLQRELQDSVGIVFRDRFLHDQSLTNRTIARISGDDMAKNWRGAVIAYGIRGHVGGDVNCRDIDLNDWRHLVDYFKEFEPTANAEGEEIEGENAQPANDAAVNAESNAFLIKQIQGASKVTFDPNMFSDPFSQNAGPEGKKPSKTGVDTSTSTATKDAPKPQSAIIKAVKIYSKAEAKYYKRPRFEAVDIPADHPIFNDWHGKSAIAERLEIPILARKIPQNRALHLNASNQEAAYLHLCIDPKSPHWGWAPRIWDLDIGSVLVVREDKRPLLPLQMKALAHYCRFDLGLMFQNSNSIEGMEGATVLSRDFILSAINKQMFEIFLDKVWRGRNLVIPERFASPYEDHPWTPRYDNSDG